MPPLARHPLTKPQLTTRKMLLAFIEKKVTVTFVTVTFFASYEAAASGFYDLRFRVLLPLRIQIK